MRWMRRLSLVAVLLAAVTFGGAAPASANVGWVYTQGKASYGAAYFDSDSNGYPGYEKLTVCDNHSDSHGIIGIVFDLNNRQDSYQVKDPSNDGKCANINTAMFPEDARVQVDVCRYHNVNIVSECASAVGRA